MRLTVPLSALLAALAPSLAAAHSVTLEAHPFAGSRFFVPASEEPRTSVIMLHGSEGGSVPYIESEGALLASQGFSVLVLCYFDCSRGLVGPRKTLRDIDTSVVSNAISWLRDQPHSNGKVVVYGFSRGAEFTMIIGSLVNVADFEKPTALIAHSPSDRFNSFYNWSWQEPSCWICRRGLGQCSDRSPRSDFQWNPACGPDDETRMDFSRSAWQIAGLTVPAGTRIEIEKYEGPILITVGENDQTWPVAQTRRIEATLRGAGRTPEVHYFPGAGHVFSRSDENSRRALVLDFLRRLP